jgi:hypothetical protein
MAEDVYDLVNFDQAKHKMTEVIFLFSRKNPLQIVLECIIFSKNMLSKTIFQSTFIIFPQSFTAVLTGLYWLWLVLTCPRRLPGQY